jgi:polyribonucleotide nucleotidyltransferase
MAKQADGAALVQYGETVVLATAVAAKDTRPDLDFFPLTVDYVEKTFAAGKIPGGFFKREGRPSEKEVLTSRMIDRSVRPLFSGGLPYETQIIATVLSVDKENDADVVAMIATAVALELSSIPFQGPMAGVRVGRLNRSWVINPKQSELISSDINLFLSGTPDAIVMVEGGAQVAPEDDILEALFFGHDALKPLFDLMAKLKAVAGKPKREVAAPERDGSILRWVEKQCEAETARVIARPNKTERQAGLDQIQVQLLEASRPEIALHQKDVLEAFVSLKRRLMRQMIIGERRRVDGRGLTDIRPVTCEVEVLPRTHGSALFTRGETQALTVTTLGTGSDEQKIDALIGEHYKKFMLHYNFPPFSVGEVKFLRSPGRREIGHGALAERALLPVLPSETDFPYTIRIVSEILESNGSTSMATVCGGTLSLMDSGVPIKAPVAGIAMGLIKEGGEVRVLSDILGDEDHLGDMDFKVAGTREGITAVQMDIKMTGVTREIMREALYQAKEGRLYILGVMTSTISTPRREISLHAPRIVTLKVKPDKVRDIIGPGGKVIRGIVEETGAKIDVEDDGTVLVASSDDASCRRAVEIIRRLTAEAEVGKTYTGTVRRIMDFGAFVEIFPGTDGLVHISQLANERVKKVTDVVKEGDTILVKVLEIDRQGKIRLSRKEALELSEKPASTRSP